MIRPLIPLHLFVPAIIAIVGTVGSILAHFIYGTASVSRWRLAASITPSLAQLGLFYSLALHMHRSLGHWPYSIGERGFSPGLLAHATVATHYFMVVLAVTLFLWPVTFLVRLLVRGWRQWLFYLGVHVLTFTVCICLMLLAPAQFLYWWWD